MPELGALAFGATIAIAIGPIALLIINVAASAGLRSGLASAAGAAAADFSYALLTFFAGTAASRVLAEHRVAAQLMASMLLLGFGVWIAAGALRTGDLLSPPIPGSLLRHPFVSVYALTIANPLTIIAFAGFAPQLPLAGSATLAAWYATCVGFGSLAGQMTLAGGGSVLGRLLAKRGGLRLMSLASGVGIVAFGVAGLARVVSP
jgi:threonine/homoserine/homoserine lactone efflux protein